MNKIGKDMNEKYIVGAGFKDIDLIRCNYRVTWEWLQEFVKLIGIM